MPKPIEGLHYLTQQYGKTQFAQSDFGKRAYKAFGGIHPGLDFGTKGINLPAISTCVGRVVRASMDGGWGYHVEVRGEDGWNRQYAHLQTVDVKVGDTVEVGTRLGRVGNTGASVGTHLHWGHRRRTLLGTWEYRNPFVDLEEKVVEAKMPKGKLIKGSLSAIYAFNGKTKFHIPDMETLTFLFCTLKIEEVGQDIISKIPTGTPLPSMK